MSGFPRIKKRKAINRLPPAHPHNKTYDRVRDLPRLLALWPKDLNDFSAQGYEDIINKIARALCAERRKAKSNQWSYDLNRHIGLKQAYISENALLKKLYPRHKAIEPKSSHKSAPQ